MTSQELEAKVLAQECLLIALAHKAVRRDEKLSLAKLLADQGDAAMARLRKGDPAVLGAFNAALTRLQKTLPMGSNEAA